MIKDGNPLQKEKSHSHISLAAVIVIVNGCPFVFGAL